MPERRRRRIALAGAATVGLLAGLCLGHGHHRPPHHPPPHPPHDRAQIVSLQGDSLNLVREDLWAKAGTLTDKTWIHEGPRRRLDRSALRADLYVHERGHRDGSQWILDEVDVLPGQLTVNPGTTETEEATSLYPWLLGSGLVTAAGVAAATRRRRS